MFNGKHAVRALWTGCALDGGLRSLSDYRSPVFRLFCTNISTTLRHSKRKYYSFNDLHFHNRPSIGTCQKA